MGMIYLLNINNKYRILCMTIISVFHHIEKSSADVRSVEYNRNLINNINANKKTAVFHQTFQLI